MRLVSEKNGPGGRGLFGKPYRRMHRVQPLAGVAMKELGAGQPGGVIGLCGQTHGLLDSAEYPVKERLCLARPSPVEGDPRRVLGGEVALDLVAAFLEDGTPLRLRGVGLDREPDALQDPCLQQQQ